MRMVTLLVCPKFVSRATMTAPAAAQERGMDDKHSEFVGSVPETYDEHLGPLLFETMFVDTPREFSREFILMTALRKIL